MALVSSEEVRGSAFILQTPLAVHKLRDALFIPFGRQHKPGIYDAEGVLMRPAAYFRGLPEAHFPLEDQLTTLAHRTVDFAPDGPLYVFAGHLTGHYGHFLFSMLSRLWSLPRPVPEHVRLVMLNGVHAPDLFELDFSARIFHALGLSINNFVALNEPVRFRELIVPSPAIEENHFGHPAFADLCHDICGRVLGGAAPSPRRRPVFLTKQRLTKGVHRIVNERALCEALQRRGVEIVSPELLPFVEQLRLWAGRSVVGGVFGSMMHTSIFIPSRSYVALNPESWINSNQVILDELNGNSTTVLHPSEGYLNEEPPPGFQHGLRLQDPESTAIDFLEAMDRAPRSAKRRKPSAMMRLLSSARR